MNFKILLGIPLIAICVLAATNYPEYWWALLFGIAFFLKRTWFSMISNSENVDTIKRDNKIRESLDNKEITSMVQVEKVNKE